MELPKTVLEPFEIDGFWWLPDQPDYRVPGKLKYHPKHGISIDLLQPLKKFEPGVKYTLNAGQHHPTVFGVIVDGSFVALTNVLDVGVSKLSGKAAVIMLSRLISNSPVLIFPNMAPCLEDVWTQATIEITNQDAFFIHQPVSHGHSANDLRLQSLRFNTPSYLQDPVDLGSVSLSVNLIHSGPFQTYGRVVYEHGTSFVLKFAKPMSIQNIIGEAWKLATLFTILTGRNQLVRKLHCGFEQEGKDRVERLACHPYFIIQDPELFQEQSSIHMLFHAEDFKDQLPSVIQNFYSRHDQLATSFGLYMAVVNTPDLNTSFAYSAYAQSLEGLFNILYGNSYYMTSTKHKRFRRALREHYPDDLDTEYIDSLNDAIRQSNRLTLNTKLHRLFERIDKTLLEFLTNNPTALVSRLVEWRNAIAHGYFDPKEIEHKLFERDFYTIEVLLHAVLLDSIGIDGSLVSQRLVNHKKLLFSQLEPEPTDDPEGGVQT